MKWVKKYSYFFFKLLIIFFLQTKIEEIMQTTTSFKNKAKMLWKWFFSSELQTDFNNMKNYCYSFKIESVLKVNKTNIFWILSRMCNIIFDMNSIFNSFLKIINISFIKMIIILTQTFWNVFYYSKQF